MVYKPIVHSITRTLTGTYLENYSNNIIADVPLSLNLESDKNKISKEISTTYM